MTELLYQTDSYLIEFNAKITDVLPEKNAFILNRTAFYPGGGGQAYDLGSIRFDSTEIQLKRTKNSSDGILHILEDGVSLPKTGQRITGIIDWNGATN